MHTITQSGEVETAVRMIEYAQERARSGAREWEVRELSELCADLVVALADPGFALTAFIDRQEPRRAELLRAVRLESSRDLGPPGGAD